MTKRQPDKLAFYFHYPVAFYNALPIMVHRDREQGGKMKNSLISTQLVRDAIAKGIRVKRWPRWRRIGRLDPMITLTLPNGVTREIFLTMHKSYFLGYTVQAASDDINVMIAAAVDDLSFYL